MTPEPCPFCGGQDVDIRRKGYGESRKYHIFCNCCEAEGPPNISGMLSVELWNERHHPYQAEIDALKAELRQLKGGK